MATGNVTPTTIANWIPEVWSKKIISAAESKLVAASLVDRYDADVANRGDTIHVPNLANMSAVAKTPGTDVTYSVDTEGKTDISIDKQYYVARKIEKISAIQSDPDIFAKYTQKMGYALAKQIDTNVLGLYADTSNTVVGNTSTAFTQANFALAIRYLDEADAPDYDRSFVVGPALAEDLRKISEFTRYDALGTGKGLTDAAIGQFLGVKFYISNNTPTVTSTPEALHNVLFQKEAFALAMQKNVNIIKQEDADSIGDKLVAWCLYGVKCMRADFCVDYTISNA